MAHATDLRPRHGTGPLEYAFLLVLVAGLTTVAMVVLSMVGSGRVAEAGSCLTSSVCTVGGATSATHAPAAERPQR